ncbi:Origin recognition complex subunit 2 [Orchesella cincta]|uniref:Origin recognition complex subunit 2 n=1 Tax=Orchesella cincta TaxID=48709 RepID=A0A1D2NE33_ORCCI|nr:Origin recognition complex subunit 2 [Orchesella cincta]
MSERRSMVLRNHSTPTKDRSYEDVIQTPIGRHKPVLEQETPKSLRSVGRRAASGRYQRKDNSPSSKSNEENEGIQKLNESTPNSKLSRNRQRSIIYTPTINEDEKSIKAVFRLGPDSGNDTPTPRRSSRPLRQSVLKSNALSKYKNDLPSSDEDSNVEGPTPKSTRHLRRSYFTKEDSDEYSAEEDELSESDDDKIEDDLSTASSNDEDETTPKGRQMNAPDLSQLPLTPDVLHQVKGRAVKRRLAVDSPVATSSQTMSPNPEVYFLAENRIKFRKKAKVQEAMNDAMKGKRRRRKVIQSADSRLPEHIPSDFSVTSEATKATVNPENFIAGKSHDEEAHNLLKNVIENEFPHWLGLFRDSFNVLIYGYGSKLCVLKHFEKFLNEKYLVVNLNGLFPKLNPRKFVYGLCEAVNPDLRVPHGSSLEAVAKEASSLLAAESHPDVFILLNNFDSMVLRSPQMLTALCWMAQVPYIHILASCDTVNAFLGVTQSQALQLRFCWSHCPTYIQYREELKWTPDIYGDESKAATQKSSLKYVLQSLTGNARKAFALLAQLQLKQMKSRAVQKSKEAYAGVRFQELAKECREKFIAHSDENLRTLLVEFFDHKLIRQTGKGRHLENMLLIELDVDTMEEIISDSL